MQFGIFSLVMPVPYFCHLTGKLQPQVLLFIFFSLLLTNKFVLVKASTKWHAHLTVAYESMEFYTRTTN